MPTYDYRCEACEHAFEEFQSITAAPLKTCPSCNKPKLRRLIGTGAGILFKGGGFYETDYRSDSYKKAAEADKPAGKPAESSASSDAAPSKADAKPKPTDSSGAAKPAVSQADTTAAKPRPTKPAKPKTSD